MLNVRSVSNKFAVIYNHFVENNLDVLCVTETWFNNSDISSCLLSSLLSPNYNLAQRYGRPLSMRGGGAAIIKHNSINHTSIKTKIFSFFECIGWVITSPHSTFKLFVIYRPPSSSIFKFFTKLESLIECHISSSIDLFFLGDFNIKIYNINNYNTQHFKRLLQNFGLSQHVFFPTHDPGHILDLIITKVSSKFNIRPFCIDTCIFDHNTVCVGLNLAKSHRKKLFLIVVSRISISLNLIKIILLPFLILNTSA